MPVALGGYCGNPLYFDAMRRRFSWLFPVLLLASAAAFAQTPIHQCKDANGDIIYSQLPCKDEAPAEPEAEAEEAPPEPPAPISEVVEYAPPSAADSRRPGESAAACKKRYRDAIDAIDAEIRRDYSPDKDADYKQRLLALTRQLRAC